MVFGGFGIMLYGGESPLLAFDKVMDKVDVQSMFFATMFMIIILVLGTPSFTIFHCMNPLIVFATPHAHHCPPFSFIFCLPLRCPNP